MAAKKAKRITPKKSAKAKRISPPTKGRKATGGAKTRRVSRRGAGPKAAARSR